MRSTGTLLSETEPDRLPTSAEPGPPLRICLLAETFHPVLGGGETQARLLAQELTRRGHSVLVVTRRTHGSLPRHDRLGTVRILRVGPVGSRGALRWPMVGTAAAALLRRRHDLDVVLVLGFRALGLAGMALRTLGIPCVMKAESNGEMSGAFFARGLERFRLSVTSLPGRMLVGGRNRLLLRADGFVAISREIQQEFERAGVGPSRTARIPNAVDTERFRPLEGEAGLALRARLGFAREDRIVTYTGRLVRYKGLPGLLRVWSRIAPAYPAARLLLVGEGGLDLDNCEEELKSYVREHRLEERVVFTGGVENVEDYLRISDCFVFPTENEAFGASLIEAMACALPCIASATGGIPEIVTPGVDGVLVPPGDLEALERGICWLLDHPGEAAALAAAARATAVERYRPETVAARYEEVLRLGIARRRLDGIV